MGTAAANRESAGVLLDQLCRSGVRHLCLSPGSRSTPLVLAAERYGELRRWVVGDERACAYFAIGLARATGTAAAILSTSGTAAANFAPAVAEAFFSQVPLIVVTADRPPELRDFGAAQTIHQPDLFAGHLRWRQDLLVPGVDTEDLLSYYRAVAARAVAVATAAPQGPVHLNVPLREPLLDESASAGDPTDLAGGTEQPSLANAGEPAARVYAGSAQLSDEQCAALSEQFAAAERGLICCGPGAARDQATAAAIAALAEARRWPLLADPLSGLRFESGGSPALVDGYDLLLRSEDFTRLHEPDVILRLGGLPVSKAALSFLARSRATQVLLAPHGQWPDPVFRTSQLLWAETAALCRRLAGAGQGRGGGAWLAAWQQASERARSGLSETLAADGELHGATVACAVLGRLGLAGTQSICNSMPV